MKLKEYLTPALKKASDEEIALIGVASFGANLGFLESEHPGEVKKFCKEYGIKRDKDFDRKMAHFIKTQVEPTNRTFATASGATITMNKKPSFQDVLTKAENLRKSSQKHLTQR